VPLVGNDPRALPNHNRGSVTILLASLILLSDYLHLSPLNLSALLIPGSDYAQSSPRPVRPKRYRAYL
jgi:hypothetical protein